MPAKIGSTPLNKAYLGANAVGKIYLGDVLIWSSGAPPVNVDAPVISVGGDPLQPGTVISYSGDTWTNTPTDYEFQWYSDGLPIPGATLSTYTIDADEIGTMISLGLIASNEFGSSSEVLSNELGPIEAAPSPPVNIVPPVIAYIS